MLPDNIDDLFRQQLDGHATPPAPDLWARLQLLPPAANPVDTVFQDGLHGHATPPRRELWERLEDEHLRPQPRRRRATAWWQLSAAAILLLLLPAGGGLWWRGSYRHLAGDGVAQLRRDDMPNKLNQLPADNAAGSPAAHPQALATTTTPTAEASEKKQDSFSSQATAPHSFASSTPIATATRPRRAATTPRANAGLHLQRSQPDAAAGTLARHGGRTTPADQSSGTSSHSITPVLASTSHDTVAPALATAVPVVAPAATPEIIEVEVRRGSVRPTPAAVVVADAAPVAPTRRRGLRLGGLLRQADHLVHGEPVSLAEATGLPETMTVQARLGSRLLSKTIQL